MYVGEARPGDRLQAGGGVELHGARAQWDHRAVQREVLVAERADVAHHLRLGVDAVERLVGEELGGALQRRGNARGTLGSGGAEASQQRLDVGVGGVLAEGHPDGGLIDCADQVPSIRQLCDDLRYAFHTPQG